ncbi:MAG: YtxH domain-containing protein [Bryobacteraceae bacterium]
MEDDSKLSFFFLGLGLGAALGILFAPKSGEETRDFLRSKAGEGSDYLKRQSETVVDAAGNVIERTRTAAGEALDKTKTTVVRQKDNLSAAMEAGKQAYREAVAGGPSEGV